MPAATYQIPGGARVFIFTCDTCGAPASFGYDVHLLQAIDHKDVTRAGRWYCAAHNPLLTPEAQDAPVTETEAPHEQLETGDLFDGP